MSGSSQHSFRPDIVNEELLLAALRHHEGVDLVTIEEFNVAPGTNKGDNYLGDLASVKLTAQVNKNGVTQSKSYWWMVKMLKPDPPNNGMNMGRILGAFDGEARLYRDLIPALLKLGSVPMAITVPMVYVDDTVGKEALILEHMGQFGWRDAIRKKEGLDVHHVTEVLKWLATFHGLCHVLMVRHPKGKEGWLADNPWAIPVSHRKSDFMKKFVEARREEDSARMVFQLSLLETDTSPKYSQRLDSLFKKGKYLDIIRRDMQMAKEPFSTICHLDPWFNNMLFKYADEEATKLEQGLLLDLQLIGYCHPGNDLAHFIMTSTTKEFRQQHLQQMLKVYHDTLTNVVLKSGEKFDFYTLEDVKEDFKAGLSIGVTFCIMALPMVLGAPEDSVDFGGVDFDDEEAVKAFTKVHENKFIDSIKKNKNVQVRLRGIFDEMIEAGIF